MKDSLLSLLQSVDTPTVCNAIEVAQGRRGFDAFTRGTVLMNDPALGPMVGYAVTARIAARAPSEDAAEIVRARRMDYYRAMAEGPIPSVAVVQDMDVPQAVGAYWGEVNTTIHKGFGMAGALTDGVMRDLDDMAPGFPVVAGSVGPSHGFVHVTEVNRPVTVFGLRVAPGDLVHADRHGAVVIPPDVLDRLEEAIGRMQATEALILGPARSDNFDFDTFEAAWAVFEKART